MGGTTSNEQEKCTNRDGTYQPATFGAFAKQGEQIK